jgi:hypothetical protein
MARAALLIESLTVVIGLPWCVSYVLMWAGCQEPQLTANERARYEALRHSVAQKLQQTESVAPEDDWDCFPRH